ncbi:hypothetical protein [Desulfovibrio sp. X2]|uniref:hypothetical protein n=1 Tax=Desulfovibrio sp. X2 TaxID=941449 RepID=UPI00041C165B|nr:hypothetical protein [Desulfovibrio sp. X2]
MKKTAPGLLAACLLALLALARPLSAAEPEDFLGPVREVVSVRTQAAASALLAPFRPMAGSGMLSGSGPLAPLRVRRTLADSGRVGVLDANGDGILELVVISRDVHGGSVHQIRRGLPGGGFAETPAWSLATQGGSWLSGDFLPFSPHGLPGRLSVETRPFGLLGLRVATHLAYYPCDREHGGCSTHPRWRLAVKGILPPGAGVRDVDGDGRPDILVLDGMASSLTAGGLAEDLLSGRAWLALRVYLQQPDETFLDQPSAELRLPVGLSTPLRCSWETPPEGPPILRLGDPAAPWARLRWNGGTLAVLPR